MAKIESWACDVCKTQKKEANHWWLITLASNGSKGATIASWDTGDPAIVDAHLCGVQHTLEWLSKHVLESQQ